MSARTDRLLAAHVVLMSLLVISETTIVPRNQLLGTIGILVGALTLVYALAELANSFF